MSDYSDRKYMIFNVSEINQIDFNEVLETDTDSLRKSVNGLKTFVKWSGDIPDFVLNLTTKEGPYTHDEMLTILSNSEWLDPNLNGL